jgi:hypothetical protein
VTDRDGQQARIGYDLKRRDLADPGLIALRGRPRLYLGMLFKMAADDAGNYPMIRSSVMFLSADADGVQLLLHYDYERDKPGGYPEAHLQVCATSAAWEELTRRRGPQGRPLERLHLPVGGRRFRPTVEDLLEFLITEKLANGRRGWEEHVRRGREGFERRQLRAAVRRHPEDAISVLRELGHF